MNWIGVTILCWVTLGVEMAARRAFEVGGAGAAPYLLLPVVVHIAMHAPHVAAYWTGLLCGLAVDLQSVQPTSDGMGMAVVLGPNALGYLLSTYFAVQVRTIVIRRNPFSFVAVSMIAAAIGQVLAVLVMTFRGALDGSIVFAPTEQLWVRVMSAALTGISALVLAFPLRWANPVLGLQDPTARRFGRRIG